MEVLVDRLQTAYLPLQNDPYFHLIACPSLEQMVVALEVLLVVLLER